MTGELEITHGHDAINCHGVMLWDRHSDSGVLLRSFPQYREAVAYAKGYADAFGCNIRGLQFTSLNEVGGRR